MPVALSVRGKIVAVNNTVKNQEYSSLALRSYTSGEMYILAGEMTVGREMECDIRIGSPQISRMHARLSVSVDSIVVEDLNSTNGTFVNGEEISSKAVIRLGDQVSFDEISFRVTSVRSGDSISKLSLQNISTSSVNPTVQIDNTILDEQKGDDSDVPFSKTVRGRFFPNDSKRSTPDNEKNK